MQGEAIEIAQEAMQKYNIEKDIAQHIKKTFDDRKGPTWHCIVGRNFGSFVTHGMAFSLLSDLRRTNEVVRQYQIGLERRQGILLKDGEMLHCHLTRYPAVFLADLDVAATLGLTEKKQSGGIRLTT